MEWQRLGPQRYPTCEHVVFFIYHSSTDQSKTQLFIKGKRSSTRLMIVTDGRCFLSNQAYVCDTPNSFQSLQCIISDNMGHQLHIVDNYWGKTFVNVTLLYICFAILRSSYLNVSLYIFSDISCKKENTHKQHAYSGMHGCTHTQCMQIFIDICQIYLLYSIFVCFEFPYTLCKHILLKQNRKHIQNVFMLYHNTSNMASNGSCYNLSLERITFSVSNITTLLKAGWQTTTRELAYFRWGVYKISNRSSIHYHISDTRKLNNI